MLADTPGADWLGWVAAALATPFWTSAPPPRQ